MKITFHDENEKIHGNKTPQPIWLAFTPNNPHKYWRWLSINDTCYFCLCHEIAFWPVMWMYFYQERQICSFILIQSKFFFEFLKRYKCLRIFSIMIFFECGQAWYCFFFCHDNAFFSFFISLLYSLLIIIEFEE